MCNNIAMCCVEMLHAFDELFTQAVAVFCCLQKTKVVQLKSLILIYPPKHFICTWFLGQFIW